MQIIDFVTRIKTDLEHDNINSNLAAKRIANCDTILKKIKKNPNADYSQEVKTLLGKAVACVPADVYTKWRVLYGK